MAREEHAMNQDAWLIFNLLSILLNFKQILYSKY